MRDTVYTPIPVGANDNKTKDQFGEIRDPFELNIIKESDYDYNPDNSNNNSNNTQPTTSTRRTLDTF